MTFGTGEGMPAISLSDAQIEQIYEVVRQYWEQHLKGLGVKLPALRKRDGSFTKDALVLVYLAYDYPDTRWVTKVELTEFVRTFYPDTPDVQSARHLGMQKGFYIISTRRGNSLSPDQQRSSAYKLETLEKPHPSWRPRRQARETIDFERLKQQYGHRCVTCGSREGEESWRYPGVITQLQQGHRNPHEPLGPKNVIPQCDQCNRADRGKWVYDERGRVIGVAESGVIIQSVKKGYLKENDLRKLYNFLKERLEGGGGQ